MTLAIQIGFVPFGWKDLFDVLVVAFLVYQLYRVIRGTVAVQVSLLLLGIYIVDVFVRAANLVALRALFGAISEVFVLAVIILFQPEIRRLLFMLGRNPLVRRFVATPAREKVVEEVVAAVRDMAENRIGSLTAFARSSSLRNYAESGTKINAEVERDLLTSIFFPNSPLHAHGHRHHRLRRCGGGRSGVGPRVPLRGLRPRSARPLPAAPRRPRPGLVAPSCAPVLGARPRRVGAAVRERRFRRP